MNKFIKAALILVTLSLQNVHALSLSAHELSSQAVFEQILQESALLNDPVSIAPIEAYPNGTFYFLIGDLDNRDTRSEYESFYKVSTWLVTRGFKVVINPVAYQVDIEEALKDPKTVAILWSSHGSKENGTVEDNSEADLPNDIFMKSINLKLLILSSCHGDKVSKRYPTKPGVKKVFWNGVTYSRDLFGYLESSNFLLDISQAAGSKKILPPAVKFKR